MIVLQAAFNKVPSDFKIYMTGWRDFAVENECEYLCLSKPDNDLGFCSDYKITTSIMRLRWASRIPEILWVDWDIELLKGFRFDPKERYCDYEKPDCLFYTGPEIYTYFWKTLYDQWNILSADRKKEELSRVNNILAYNLRGIVNSFDPKMYIHHCNK